jgi:hypothetical protein
MSRRSLTRTRIGLAAIALLVSIAGIGAATPASGQALVLPTPKDFVSHLDLECFQTDPGQPPQLPTALVLSHLNPALANLPRFQAILGPRTQLCAPVAKNDRIPPSPALDFIRFVDLSCYQLRNIGPGPIVPLKLNHLNPQLANLPTKEIRLLEPEQLCLPVIKNGVFPPTREVFNLIQFIDLACFREDPPVPLNIGLRLSQLNPELRSIPPTAVRVTDNRQLCVPVRKNNQEIPRDVLNIVQWIDLEKYDIVAPPIPAFDLKLTHINPLFKGWSEPATLLERQQLAVPVAKDG